MIRPSGLRPLALLLALAALVSAACDVGPGGLPSAPIDGHPTTLARTTWNVSAIGGVPVTIGNGPTIAFDETIVKGSGGCNQLGGRYQYDAGSGQLRFEGMGMTAMACAEPERNAIETGFLRVLGQPSLVATMEPDGRLALVGPAGRIDLEPTSSTNGG